MAIDRRGHRLLQDLNNAFRRDSLMYENTKTDTLKVCYRIATLPVFEAENKIVFVCPPFYPYPKIIQNYHVDLFSIEFFFEVKYFYFLIIW